MEKIVVANLKMNMLYNDVLNYLDELEIENNSNIIICPSNIFIPYFLNRNIEVGLQNVSEFDIGAYTGEASALQAGSLGIKYAIVGHSERRLNNNESNTCINHKIKAGLKNGLKIILCVGDTLKDKENNNSYNKIKIELLEDLKGIEDFENIFIAYEPIWSVSTSINPVVSTPEEIDEMALYIKKIIKENYGYDDIKVLYGGSVKTTNIEEINNIDSLSGVLVGGDSLNPKNLMTIGKIVSK